MMRAPRPRRCWPFAGMPDSLCNGPSTRTIMRRTGSPDHLPDPMRRSWPTMSCVWRLPMLQQPSSCRDPEVRRYRFGVVASHVIQYYGPLFRLLAAHPAIDLTVLFCSRRGAEPYLDHDLGVRLKWDLPLLEGYSHEFLRNFAPTEKGFFRVVNPGVFRALRRGKFDGVF